MSLALAIRAAVILGLAAAGARAMRGARPASRHALWHAAIVAALALPLASFISPSWALVERSVSPSVAQDRPVVRVTEDHRLPTASIAMVWVAGSTFVALYVLAGHVRLWRMRRRARPAPVPWAAAAARLVARGRLSRPIEVRVSPEVDGPLVTGIWSPAVLIPSNACSWSDTRRNAVLVHELAHVGRGDLAAHLAGQVLATLHWFNPLAWYALAEMRRERELACDEAVIAAGVEPLAYATDLLDIARAAADRHLPAATVSMARHSDLEDRLSAVLTARPARSEPSRRSQLALALVMVAIGTAVSGAQLTKAAGSEAPRPGTRRTVWTLLPDVDETIVRAADDGRDALATRGARERNTLILALTPGREVIPPLLDALGDPDARVREKAALGLAWRRDDRIGPALVAAAADPAPGVREKALVALAFSDEPRAAALIAAARTDPDPGVRDKAHALELIK